MVDLQPGRGGSAKMEVARTVSGRLRVQDELDALETRLQSLLRSRRILRVLVGAPASVQLLSAAAAGLRGEVDGVSTAIFVVTFVIVLGVIALPLEAIARRRVRALRAGIRELAGALENLDRSPDPLLRRPLGLASDIGPNDAAPPTAED